MPYPLCYGAPLLTLSSLIVFWETCNVFFMGSGVQGTPKKKINKLRIKIHKTSKILEGHTFVSNSNYINLVLKSSRCGLEVERRLCIQLKAGHYCLGWSNPAWGIIYSSNQSGLTTRIRTHPKATQQGWVKCRHHVTNTGSNSGGGQIITKKLFLRSETFKPLKPVSETLTSKFAHKLRNKPNINL